MCSQETRPKSPDLYPLTKSLRLLQILLPIPILTQPLLSTPQLPPAQTPITTLYEANPNYFTQTFHPVTITLGITRPNLLSVIDVGSTDIFRVDFLYPRAPHPASYAVNPSTITSRIVKRIALVPLHTLSLSPTRPLKNLLSKCANHEECMRCKHECGGIT